MVVAHKSRIVAVGIVATFAWLALSGMIDTVRYYDIAGKVPWGPQYNAVQGEQFAERDSEVKPPEGCDAWKANSMWVPLARENIRQGGPVWRVFQNYYARCVK
jgi:hypothetical protein